MKKLGDLTALTHPADALASRVSRVRQMRHPVSLSYCAHPCAQTLTG